MKKSIVSLFYLCFSLFSSVPGALQAGEQGPWYLVSETELRSIEEYRKSSEVEKQTWLSQVQTLKAQAEHLRRESETLNSQLSIQREQSQALSKSFNGLEREWLTKLSRQTGEIASLTQTIAEKNLETRNYKSKAMSRLVIIIALLAAVAGYAAFKILRHFRLI